MTLQETIAQLLRIAFGTTLTISTILCLPSWAGSCCESQTNKKPEWKSILAWPSPASKTDCTWESKEPDQLIFTRSDRAIVGLHLGCFRTELSLFAPGRFLAAHTIDFVFVVDARTGAVTKKAAFNDLSAKRERNMEMQLLALPNHKILLRTDFTLVLLNENLEILRTRNLPAEDEEWEHWAARASNDGATVLLRHWGVGKENQMLSEDHWISPDTLENLLSEDPRPYGSMFFAVGNDVVYFQPKLPDAPRSVEQPVALRRRGQMEYHTLCESCTGVAGGVTNNGLVLLEHASHDYWLVNPEGKVLFRGTYGQGIDVINSVSFAVEKNRFAFNFGHGRVGWFVKDADIGGLVVFDADKVTEVLSIKEKVYPKKEGSLETWPPSIVALSPDGNQLLVLNGVILKSFMVPEKAAPTQQARKK